jgi:hypothetical protein
VRRERALHPRGVVWAATTTFVRPVPGVAGLDAPCAVDALLRLSRAIGLPAGAPDILGLAVRLHDADGPGRPVDLLLASSPPPPLHCVLAPARGFERTWFTSLLPYRVGEQQTILVAHASGPGRFALSSADPGHRRPQPLAEIRVIRRLASSEASSFDPILHAATGLRQDAGRLDAFRACAYRASRRGRGRTGSRGQAQRAAPAPQQHGGNAQRPKRSPPPIVNGRPNRR